MAASPYQSRSFGMKRDARCKRLARSSPRVGAAIDKHLLLVSTKISFCLIQWDKLNETNRGVERVGCGKARSLDGWRRTVVLVDAPFRIEPFPNQPFQRHCAEAHATFGASMRIAAFECCGVRVT
jgi:hypothetical protein